MARTIIVLVVAVLLLVAAGTAALAHGGGRNSGTFTFSEMLPFMQEHHPNWSEEELREMYDTCHGSENGTGWQNRSATMM